MIITRIGCKISQSYKIMCDVLIRVGVGEPSCSRNIPNNKVSIWLLGTTTKLGIMGSFVTETGAQLAANILVSRPLANLGVAPILLPIVWLLVYSRLALYSSECSSCRSEEQRLNSSHPSISRMPSSA